MSEQHKVKLIAKYEGHNVKKNQNASLSLSCAYNQLNNVIQLMGGLNVDIDTAFKEADKTVRLGEFRLWKVCVENDGSSILQFNSMADYIEFEPLGFLAQNAEEEFVMLFKYTLEE